MNQCILRQWQLSDAQDLAATLNNQEILNNLPDGLPFPYTQQDATAYITAMLSADPNSTFAYDITLDDKAVGSIGAFYRCLGFAATNTEQVHDGIRYTPMVYRNPAEQA